MLSAAAHAFLRTLAFVIPARAAALGLHVVVAAVAQSLQHVAHAVAHLVALTGDGQR